MNQYECACEHGENCTKTTMCKVQSAVEITESRIKDLETTNKHLVKIYFEGCDADTFDDAMLELKAMLDKG